MKKNKSIKNFFLKLKKLGVGLFMLTSITLIFFISSLNVVSAQSGNTQQGQPARVPLSERIGHTDISRAREGKNVHQGTGTLFMQTMLGRGGVTGLNFMHHGPLMPKSSIGHHFHTNSDEMFLILEGTCEFTINGQTALLEGPIGVPLKSGDAHAVYNPSNNPADWVNFNVALNVPVETSQQGGMPARGAFNYSADPSSLFEMGDDRSNVQQLSSKPTFINTGKLTKESLRPVINMNGGKDTVFYRRTLGAGAFASNWAFVDHLLIPVGATVGRHYHKGVDEVYFVMKGKGKVRVNDEVAEITYGDAIPVKAGEIHTLESSSTEPLELVIYGIALEKGKLDYVDVPLKMAKLQMFFEVESKDFEAFEKNYIDVYVPALRKQVGYLGSKLIRAFPANVLKNIGSPETKFNFQMELIFDTEEHRVMWTKTAEHDYAWPKTAAFAKSYHWIGYDIVGMDQVNDPLGDRNMTTETN
ncbi:MAG: cupin domain-containing protein [Bacteroidales bacterium]|jgi:mannose-6-phosphate isomerase-like protein (cupin superfamily)|nr:cupin domain-containing protein [Bacteroidales bacterium]